jgi:glycosyltransferase involved in cell wall biosynthesis
VLNCLTRSDLLIEGELQLKILCLTKYDRLGSSSRVRLMQYEPYLRGSGIECTISPLFTDEYLKTLYASGKRPLKNIMWSYMRRITSLATCKNYDLIWIEKEILPYFPPVLERVLKELRIPYAVDFDDALFHQYDMHDSGLVRKLLGNKIAIVMKHASLVMAGNAYLAKYAEQAGATRVEVVPTTVDIMRYAEGSQSKGEHSSIVWIGSPKTAKYLTYLTDTLRDICWRYSAKVILIGADIRHDLPECFESIRWEEATEVDNLRRGTVGIMPLPDEPWERGKCGFKLIQYMACSLPVVASPVGVNNDIVEHGYNGYLASGRADWAHFLSLLLENDKLRYEMGKRGREKAEREYSMQVIGPRIAHLLKSTVLSRMDAPRG